MDRSRVRDASNVAGAPGVELLRGHAVLRPVQPADDRLVRRAAAAVLGRQLRRRSVAYIALGAPVGEHADWTVRGALTQGDIASWIVAGDYATRAPARHRYDIGLSYSTQRYDGGNFAALRDVTDGSRNAGAIYGFDTFSITPRRHR